MAGRYSQRNSFLRQSSFGRERSLSSPKTPTDARTKRRLNTLLQKAGMQPKAVTTTTDDIDSGVLTVRKEYKRRLTAVFEDHNPEKVSNVPAILAKHGNNLHSIYIKVCKKYDRSAEPEYTGPTKSELEESIDRLTEGLRDAKQSQHEFQFYLEEALDAGEKLMLAQEELQDRNSNLENMIESARQAAGEQSALQQARMQGEINGLMTENKRIGKDKVQLLQLKHDLEERINELMGERDKDGDLILKLNDDIERMKHKIGALEDDHAKATVQHTEAMESTKTRLTRQLTWVKETAEEDRKMFEQQQEDMSVEASQTIEGLESELSSLKDQLEAERVDNRKLGKHKVQLLQERKNLEEKVEMLETEREQDGDLILKLNDDIESYKKSVADLDEQFQDFKALHDRVVEKDRKTLEKTKIDYDNQLTALREAKVDDRIRYEGEIQNLQEELADTKQTFEQEVASLENVLQSTKDNNARKMNDTITKYEGEVSVLNTEKRNLEDDLLALENELTELKKSFEDEVNSLETLLRNTREQNSRKMEDTINNYETQLAVAKDEHRMDVRRLESHTQDTKKSFEEQIRDLETTMDLKDRRAQKTMKDTVENYENQLSISREQKVEDRIRFETQIQELHDELTDTRQKFEQTTSDMERQHSLAQVKAQKNLKSTVQNYENQLAISREQKVDDRMKFEHRIEALENKLSSTKSSLEGKVSALEQERDKDGDLILRLNDDCENYKKKVSSLEHAQGDLESHLQEVKTTHTRTLAETKTTLQRQMTFVEEASREEKARMQKIVQDKESHSSEKSRAMNQRISELTDALEMERTENGKKVAAYTILKQKFDNQETEMANMMDDLIAKTNKIRELEKTMRDQGGAEPNEAMQRQSRLQNLRIQELELEIERINRTSVSKTQELEETCKLFQRDLKQQKELVKQLTKEKQQLLSQHGGTDSAVVQHLQQQLAETKRKYEQSNETVIRLDEALRGALAKQDDFTSKITELKGEIGRLQRKTTRAESFISETTVE